MQVDPIIAPLLHSSKLPVYLEELNAYYAEEKQKRQQFYNQLSDEGKAEFIEGEVVMHSPAKHQHNECSALLLTLLVTHVNLHRLGTVTAEKALIRLTRNDFEPDICFFGKRKAASLEKATMLYPAPDLVVEILSESTEGIDRGVKFNDYALHNVAEYWIINAEKEFIEQYFLEEGSVYELNLKVKDGMISSRAIQGFTIPVEAAFNKEKNVAALQSLLTK